jgi:hypothetical protein
MNYLLRLVLLGILLMGIPTTTLAENSDCSETAISQSIQLLPNPIVTQKQQAQSKQSLDSENPVLLAYGETPTQYGCCKICRVGKACGNSCISRYYNCHQPPGCACDAD